MGKNYHSHCTVSKTEWDALARGAATMVLTEEETYDYFDHNDPYPYVFPKDACKICGWSEPTFRKYARKYLMPEIYGELPSDFFDEEHIGESKAVNAKKLPRLKI